MSEDNPTFFPEPEQFRSWLEANHETAEELWVAYYKKATKKLSVTLDVVRVESLEFADNDIDH